MFGTKPNQFIVGCWENFYRSNNFIFAVPVDVYPIKKTFCHKQFNNLKQFSSYKIFTNCHKFDKTEMMEKLTIYNLFKFSWWCINNLWLNFLIFKENSDSITHSTSKSSTRTVLMSIYNRMVLVPWWLLLGLMEGGDGLLDALSPLGW